MRITGLIGRLALLCVALSGAAEIPLRAAESYSDDSRARSQPGGCVRHGEGHPL